MKLVVVYASLAANLQWLTKEEREGDPFFCTVELKYPIGQS
jgi:hypothetical protein